MFELFAWAFQFGFKTASFFLFPRLVEVDDGLVLTELVFPLVAVGFCFLVFLFPLDLLVVLLIILDGLRELVMVDCTCTLLLVFVYALEDLDTGLVECLTAELDFFSEEAI